MRWLILLACAGCAAPAVTPDYRVAIDPSFSADEAGAVVRAAEGWELSVPVHFALHVGPCQDADLCVTRQPLAAGILGNTLYAQRPAIARLDADQIASYGISLEQQAAHELGHAQYLGHSGPGTLMCAWVGCQAMGVTEADVDQWRHVWP